mmetsp:Transcript_38588/g.83911  ORF Transcript_38588/g.83911 Transcript_38588/m.83911 type:complete len:480 (-) Transcript_38588:252-1691(-)
MRRNMENEDGIDSNTLLHGSPLGKTYRADIQVGILGVACLCGPGMWNAIISIGGGTDPQVASISTSLLYVCFAVTSLLAPVAVNIMGPARSLFLGSLGYPCFVGALLLYRTHALAAPVIVAGAINGIAAGILWTAQGQIMMGYPSAQQKARFMALFWCVFNSGAVIGGLITLATNYHSHQKQASVPTYVAFIAVMLTGSALTLALAPPHKVRRSDGAPVQLEKPPNLREELRGMGEAVRHPKLLLLAPLFLYANWFYTYEFDSFNGALFNVRTQGLCNAFFWGSQMAASVALAASLDDARASARRRALRACAFVALFGAATWAAALKVHVMFGLDRGASATSASRLDFLDSGGGFFFPLLVYMCFGAGDALVQCWAYWVMSQLDDDITVLSRYAGVYGSIKSAGSGIAWALEGFGVSPSTQLAINIALFTIAMPLAGYVASTVGQVRFTQLPPARDDEGADLSTPTTPIEEQGAVRQPS